MPLLLAAYLLAAVPAAVAEEDSAWERYQRAHAAVEEHMDRLRAEESLRLQREERLERERKSREDGGEARH